MNKLTPSEAIERAFGEVIRRKEADIEFNRRIASYEWLQKPYYHQAKRVRAAMDHGRVLLADETGTGKTYVAAATKILLDYEEGRKHRTLIICPKTAMVAPWNSEEINGYTNGNGHQSIYYINDPQDIKGLGGDHDFVVVNYDKWVHPHYVDVLTNEDWDLLVFDECHKMKNPNSKRSGWREKKGLSKLLENYGNRLILMSATPVPNRLNDLGMLLYALDPKMCPDPTAYNYERYPSLAWEVLNRHEMFKITKEDLKNILGLPPVPAEQNVPITLSDSEVNAYVGAWEKFLVLGEKLANLRKCLLDHRLLGYAEDSTKFKVLDEMLVEKVGNGEQAVIFTGLKTGVTQELQERYKIYNAVRIDGDVPQKQREKAIRMFREGEAPVCIGTTGTLAESVSLATGETPTSVIRLEPPFTLSDWAQTVGRVYRKGQKAPVSAYTFVAECDDRMREKMEKSLERIMADYDVVVEEE